MASVLGRLLVWAALAASAAALVAGGQAGAAHAPCTQMSCESGVSVTLDRLPARAAFVEVCAGDRCRRAPARNAQLVFVRIPEADERSPHVRVRVRVFAPGGRLLFARSRSVSLRAVRPNAGDCPPVCYIGRLRLIGGRLGVVG